MFVSKYIFGLPAALLSAGTLCLVLCAVPQQVLAQTCGDGCATAYDGTCDDGGPGSANSSCRLGTDCGDCGARFCSATCHYAYDYECDDGGPGSITPLCDYGTDCSDCGAR